MDCIKKIIFSIALLAFTFILLALDSGIAHAEEASALSQGIADYRSENLEEAPND